MKATRVTKDNTEIQAEINVPRFIWLIISRWLEVKGDETKLDEFWRQQEMLLKRFDSENPGQHLTTGSAPSHQVLPSPFVPEPVNFEGPNLTSHPLAGKSSQRQLSAREPTHRPAFHPVPEHQLLYELLSPNEPISSPAPAQQKPSAKESTAPASQPKLPPARDLRKEPTLPNPLPKSPAVEEPTPPPAPMPTYPAAREPAQYQSLKPVQPQAHYIQESSARKSTPHAPGPAPETAGDVDAEGIDDEEVEVVRSGKGKARMRDEEEGDVLEEAPEKTRKRKRDGDPTKEKRKPPKASKLECHPPCKRCNRLGRKCYKQAGYASACVECARVKMKCRSLDNESEEEPERKKKRPKKHRAPASSDEEEPEPKKKKPKRFRPPASSDGEQTPIKTTPAPANSTEAPATAMATVVVSHKLPPLPRRKAGPSTRAPASSDGEETPAPAKTKAGPSTCAPSDGEQTPAPAKMTEAPATAAKTIVVSHTRPPLPRPKARPSTQGPPALMSDAPPSAPKIGESLLRPLPAQPRSAEQPAPSHSALGVAGPIQVSPTLTTASILCESGADIERPSDRNSKVYRDVYQGNVLS